MKKVLLMMLVLAMAVSIVACGSANNNDDVNDNVNDDNGVVDNVDNDDNANVDDENDDNADAEGKEETPADVSTLDVLDAAFAGYSDEDKIYYMGGYYDNFVEGAPAVFDFTNTDNLANLLIVPESVAPYIDDCASLYNAMNFNNFTCGSYHIADAANVETFINAYKENLAGHHWMCGFPEVLKVATIGENNVVITFGATDIVNAFYDALTSVYPDAVVTESPIE